MKTLHAFETNREVTNVNSVLLLNLIQHGYWHVVIMHVNILLRYNVQHEKQKMTPIIQYAVWSLVSLKQGMQCLMWSGLLYFDMCFWFTGIYYQALSTFDDDVEQREYSVYFLVYDSLLDTIQLLMMYEYFIKIKQFKFKPNNKYSSLSNIHCVW